MGKDHQLPLMPKATAVWLVENTSLTFKQIADFCGMHELEVKGIGDGEVAQGIVGQDPINAGQLTREEITKCEANENAKLTISHSVADGLLVKKKAKYTPMARRQDKPDAIYWFLKNFPEVSDKKIIKLIGTTPTTIEAIRDKSHWNMQNIRPRDPVLLGLCSQTELDRLVSDNNAKTVDSE
ncbi:MAG UNVERIFIED_CONTAM: DUF1013 domain-containing protein [Rickettsiaceae bacterium]|jgi:hypothetical protein